VTSARVNDNPTGQRFQALVRATAVTYGRTMALAVTPGRDPDESPSDRLLANLVAVAVALVAVGFLVWLVWVYVID